MRIVGFAPGAEPYAIKLGVALQLTNILRDIGEDARRGRVYLPQEDLARFDLTDDDIFAGRIDARFRALMRFEIARARQLYAESWPGVALLSSDSRLAIGAASHVYARILDKIAANNYDVFRLRANLSTAEKLALLPDIWRKVRKLQ
jgi:15-cis-phytoene synthase